MEIVANRFTVVARGLRATACGAAMLLGVAGCGDSDKSTGPLIPAYGKVTLDGKPLPEADVEFIPTSDSQGLGGFARTNDEGLYTASTRRGEAGLPAGKYKVVISKGTHGSGAGPASSSDKPLPPTLNDEVLSPTYADRAATVLTATVPESGEATNDFHLKPGKRKTEARRAARVALP